MHVPAVAAARMRNLCGQNSVAFRCPLMEVEMAKTARGRKGKVRKVMGEYKRGKLKSGSGRRVKSRKQAVAIAMSESGQSRKRKKSRRK